jgi:ABC-type glycerol-3-phosphate transport system substrate-binding protein
MFNQVVQFYQNNPRAKWYTLAVIIVIIIAGIVFWPKPAPRQAINNQPITLTWWKPFYGQDTYSDIISDFKKLPGNSNITINVVNKDYGGQYYLNLIADIAKNAGPDIFTLRNDDLPAYKEYMTPIRNFNGSELANYRTSFADLAVRDTIDRDKVYAITTYIENMQLFYNKTLLAQNGIALPPKTWSELDRQLNLLNRRDRNSLNFTQSAISLGTGARGLDGPANINRMEDIMPLLVFQNGGQLYNYQSGSVIFGTGKDSRSVSTGVSTDQSFSVDAIGTDNPAYKATRFYTDFADVTKSRYSWNTASNNNIDAFVDGKLAYMLHYSYMNDTLTQRNPRLQFGVAEMPQLDLNLKKTYGFFFMDGINRNLERDTTKQLQRQAAENFLYYLSLPVSQRKFATKTRLPAARKDIVTEQLQGDETLRIFSAGSLYADNYYKPDVSACEKIWRDMMERNQYQGMPLDQSFAQAVREYAIIVQKGPKLRS